MIFDKAKSFDASVSLSFNSKPMTERCPLLTDKPDFMQITLEDAEDTDRRIYDTIMPELPDMSPIDEPHDLDELKLKYEKSLALSEQRQTDHKALLKSLDELDTRLARARILLCQNTLKLRNKSCKSGSDREERFKLKLERAKSLLVRHASEGPRQRKLA